MFRRFKGIVIATLIGALAITGCQKESNKTKETTEATTVEAGATTEATTESLIDSSGFTRTNDYIKTKVGKVNLRTEPNLESKIYMELAKNVYLNRTGYTDEWARVRLNDKDYYVYAKYVEVAFVEWASDNDAIRQNHIIYLDPAKQDAPDESTEKTGPGSDTEKARSGASAVGATSGIKECDVTLKACDYLRVELENRGYTVIMSRETCEVNISNAERGKAASVNDADIYIRLQAGSSSKSGTKGLMGFVVTKANPYVKRNYDDSYKLCKNILVSAYTETGSELQGIKETDDMTSLNWCEVPATSINIGFLSNEEDELKLEDKTYLKSLSKAIADGIDEYFEIGEEVNE